MNAIYFISGLGVGSALFSVLLMALIKSTVRRNGIDGKRHMAATEALMQERNVISELTKDVLADIARRLTPAKIPAGLPETVTELREALCQLAAIKKAAVGIKPLIEAALSNADGYPECERLRAATAAFNASIAGLPTHLNLTSK